jgi:predicted nucleotidyltransferase
VIPFENTLRTLCRDLDEARVRFALVGGLAVSVRTEPRFTRDADLAVAVDDDAEAERLIRTLRARGYEVDSLVEQTAAARIATVRLRRTGEAPVPLIDLLFASSGIEHEVVAGAESVEVLPGLRLAVASTGHLIALKLLSRDDDQRPQDLVDLRSLLKTTSRADLEQAKIAAGLIMARGYNRGRDLTNELRRFGVDGA